MNPQTNLTLEAYLHDHIPLSKAMQVAVLEVAPDRLTGRSGRRSV